MPKTKPWLTRLAVPLLFCLTLPPSAFADARTEARRSFRTGMELIQEGRYREGIEALERAYETLPHPNVLYNIGVAYLYAGDLSLAQSYLTRYVGEAAPETREGAEKLLKEIKQQLAAQDKEQVQEQPQEAKAPEPPPQRDTVSSIRQAADEIDRIAKAAGSDHLSQRANALRSAADELEAERSQRQAADALKPAEAMQPTVEPQTREERSGEAARALAETGVGQNESAYEEQVVSASRFAESPVDAPNATAIITSQDIRLTGLTNIGELVRRVAGVEVTSVTPNHSEVSIRGLNRRTSNKVLVLIDGRPLRQDFLGTTWLDFFPVPVEDIERIEVIRGPASALYGADAFAGVINVITRAPGTGDSFVSGGMGNHGQQRGAAGFTGKTGKLAYRVGAGLQAADNAVLAVGENRVDYDSLTDTSDRATDRIWVNGELRYEIARRSELTLGGAVVDGDHTVQGFSRLGQVSVDNGAQSQVYGSLSTPMGFRIATFWNRFEGGAGGTALAPGAIDLVDYGALQDIVDATVEWDGEFDLIVPQRFTIGGGYRYKQIQGWDWLDADHTQNHFAVYLQHVTRVTKRLKLQLSARMDKHPLLESLQFSPRGSVVYRFMRDQSFRATAGRAFRGPAFLESYLELENPTPLRGISAWGVGNPSLKPESITSYEIGYTNQASDFFAVEVNAYLNYVKDAILFTHVNPFTLSDYADPNNELAESDPRTSSYPISTLGFENESATFQQVGGEFGARVFPLVGLDLYTNYSLHDTRPTKRSAVDRARSDEQQTSLHKVNAGVQYRAPFGLDTSLDLHWFSRQVWVEQVTDLTRGVAFATFDQPSFLLINGRLGYRLLGDHLEFGVVGTNLGLNNKRQHPFGQPLDTRVLGTAKLRF